MSRLDDIERRINERMAEIDRRINDVVGRDATPVRDTRFPGAAAYQAPSGGVATPCSTDDVYTRLQSLLAPLNPDFLRWRKEGGSMQPGCGLIPSPFDSSYFASLPSRGGLRRGSFEARYDMRAEGLLQTIRDQGLHGTCWAHAALASLESSIAKNTGETIDLSENNLANLHGFFGYYNYGGNHNLASAYLLRWDGPVLERDDPYGHAGASRAFPPVKHVQAIRWVPPMRDASDTEKIKLALKTFGAIWVGYSHTNDPKVLRQDTAAFYHGGNPSPPNHAVAIVGWDDHYPASNFAVQPPGDGAWIVRNSWGAGFCDGGYFYVSYHDSTFARSTLNVAYCGAEPADNYDDVLQYDYLGLITGLGNGEHGVAANIFLAHRDMFVEAVGFYILAPGTSYRVSIRVGCESGNPSSGTEFGVTTGACEWAGYETIRLSSPVRVQSGAKFAIVVELTSPGIDKPFGVETWIPDNVGPSKIDADEGQSFFLYEGQWLDLTVPPKPGESVRPGMLNNFCCKAYVKFEQAGNSVSRERSVPHTKIGVEDFGLVAKNHFYLAALRPGEELPPSNSSAFFEEIAQLVAREAAKRNFTLGFSNIVVIKDGLLTQKSTRMFYTKNPTFSGIPKDPYDDGERLLRYAAEVATYYAKRWNSTHVSSVCVSWSWKDARIDMLRGRRTFQFLEPNNAFYTSASEDFSHSLLVFDGRNVSRDCVGHEYTHGVSTNRRRWAMYAFVTGAVNESFSDIFAKFSSWAWEGFDPNDPNRWTYSACRDMAHPENIPQNGWTVASYYLQKPKPGNPKSGWYRGRGDNGGVHLNNGVLARLCFLLCEGERFTRDDGRSFDVSPIGFDRTEELFGALLFGAYLNEEIRTLYEVCEALAKAANDLQFSDTEWQRLTAACDAVAIIRPEAGANMRGINRECKMKKVEKKLWQGRSSLPEDLAETFRRELSLDAPYAGYEVVDVTEREADGIRGAAGERRVVLQQTCKGVRVFGATAITHVRDDGTVTYFSNRFSPSVASVSGEYRIGEEGAAAAALDGRSDVGVSTVEKVVWDPATADGAGTPVFAWRVVTASGDVPVDQVIVDAETGQVLFSAPLRTV